MFCIKQELPINGQIRAKEVQLIGDNGEKIGVISLNEALERAEEKNLDLVLVLAFMAGKLRQQTQTHITKNQKLLKNIDELARSRQGGVTAYNTRG